MRMRMRMRPEEGQRGKKKMREEGTLHQPEISSPGGSGGTRVPGGEISNGFHWSCSLPIPC